MVSPTPKPEGAYRVLHTADWHLGKMLGTLERTEEHRRFLKWLGETVLTAEVDAIIVAGDIFDSATPPQAAVRLYYDFLASLHTRSVAERGCPVEVVITAGNHDSPAHLEAPRELLARISVHVCATLPVDAEGRFDAEATLVALPSCAGGTTPPRLIVAALPFLRERDLRAGQPGSDAEAIRRELLEAIAARYAEAAAAAASWNAKGVPVLATGHLTALGAAVSDSEREVHVGGLGAVGAEAFPASFAYVALGHLHRPQAVGGRETVRYSGSPLALSFGETSDKKEVRLLDFVGPHLLAQQPLPVPQPRALVRLKAARGELKTLLRGYEPPHVGPSDPDNPGDLPAWVELTVSGAANGSELLGEVHELLRTLETEKPGRFQIVRVLTERPESAPRLECGDRAGEDAAETLLSEPAAVFRRRLEQEPEESLPQAGRDAVQTAFAELHDLLEERKRSVS